MTIEVQAPEPIKITSEYLDYLIGILTGTVTPKAAAEFIPVLEIARAAQLGVAWAEVEDLLAGEDLFDLRRRIGHYCTFSVTPEGRFRDSLHYPTPVAALRALNESLRTP